MIFLWIMFLTGLIFIPAIGLLVMRWAARNGEFRNLDKIALSIFNEEEPVGEMTDHFPSSQKKAAMPLYGSRIGTPSKSSGLTPENRTAPHVQSSNSDGKYN
jgi:nitrogen fixation-related uncharacterized protein